MELCYRKTQRFQLSMMRYLGYALILVALLTVGVWAFSQFVQPVLPSDANNSLILLFTVLLAVVGFLAAFRHTVELVQLSRQRPQPERVKLTDLLHNVSLEDLRDSLLGEGGKVPWVNRDVTNVSLLMRARKIAIIGNDDVGKTREAIELVSQASSEDLFTSKSIYMLSPEYHSTRSDVLEGIHPFVVLPKESILLVDDFPKYMQSKRDLEKLARFLQSFGHGQTPYVIIVASEANLSTQHTYWLKENKFKIVPMKPMAREEAEDLVDGVAERFGLALSTPERASLVQQTFGSPAAIILGLQRIDAIGRAELTTQAVDEIALRSVVDLWSSTRDSIVQKYATAEHVLNALGSFYSAGIPAYTQLVQVFAWSHWYRQGGSSREWRSEYPRLVDFLNRNFDIDLSGDVAKHRKFVAKAEGIPTDYAQEELAEFLGADDLWHRHERQLGIGRTKVNRINALILLASQQIEEVQLAEALFNKALHIGVSSEILFARGLFYWWHSRPQLAINDLERAGSLNPKSTLVRYTLFVMHLHEGKFDSALGDLELLSESAIDARLLTIQRARVLARRGDNALVGDLLDKLEIAGNEVDLLAERLQVNIEARRWLAAVEDVSLSLGYVRQQLDASQTIELALITDRAGYYFNAQQNQNALADVEEVLQLNPINAKAVALRSMIRSRNEEFEGALADANLAMSIDPEWGRNSSDYLRQTAGSVGLTYATSESNDAALRSLNVALSLSPNDSYFLAVRGQVLRKLGDHQRAIDDLSRAIALNPPAWKALHQRGLTHIAMGNVEAAILDFQAASLPHHSFWEAGLALTRIGQVEKGLQSFRNGITSVEENSLDDPSIYDLLVLSVYHAGLDQLNKSRELIDEALVKIKRSSKGFDTPEKYIVETIERLRELKTVFHSRADCLDDIATQLAKALDSLSPR